MAITLYSACTVGIDPQIIEVEVDISRGLSNFIIVGLADTSVQESKERIRFAVRNSGFSFPEQRKVINLAPAHLPKHGSNYDVAMAIGLLMASGQVPKDEALKSLFIGELSLDGKIRGVKGLLPIINAAKDKGFIRVFVPDANKKEALLIEDMAIVGVNDLKEIVNLLKNNELAAKEEFGSNKQKKQSFEDIDFSDIKGHAHAKRALIVAAAGGHNLLLCGPPGCGKSMLAHRLQKLLPPLRFSEALEVTSLHSIAGVLKQDTPLIMKAPFRKVHHSASMTSLIGGGTIPKPGAISLAHRGVLLLDEIAEFPRNVLDSLRQPLEDNEIHIGRSKSSVRFPCQFMLVATMNPCPCGFANSEENDCRCSPGEVDKYQRKLSGPLMDRIDLISFLKKLKPDELVRSDTTEKISSAQIEKARDHQFSRQKKLNCELSHRELKNYCSLSKDAQNILYKAIEKLQISARGYDRMLKISRTLADMAGNEKISTQEILEAIQYKNFNNSD